MLYAPVLLLSLSVLSTPTSFCEVMVTDQFIRINRASIQDGNISREQFATVRANREQLASITSAGNFVVLITRSLGGTKEYLRVISPGTLRLTTEADRFIAPGWTGSGEFQAQCIGGRRTVFQLDGTRFHIFPSTKNYFQGFDREVRVINRALETLAQSDTDAAIRRESAGVAQLSDFFPLGQAKYGAVSADESYIAYYGRSRVSNELFLIDRRAKFRKRTVPVAEPSAIFFRGDFMVVVSDGENKKRIEVFETHTLNRIGTSEADGAG